MIESFIHVVYNDSAILNRLSEFPATLVLTETRILSTFRTSNSCKNGVTPSIVNFIMPYMYMIGVVIKIKLATEGLHAGPCPVHLSLTIGYIGEVLETSTNF